MGPRGARSVELSNRANRGPGDGAGRGGDGVVRRTGTTSFGRIGAILALTLLLPTTALAEESEAPEEIATTVPESEPAPEPEPDPTVDPDPVGGWAVIDSVTGRVVNVVVCTESVCGVDGEWGGVLPADTDCPGCVLRKQTNGTADGNVAGWGSSEGMDVTYDGDETGTFTIVSSGTTGDGGRTTTVESLDPTRTATDPDRMDLRTGIVSRSTEGRFDEDGQRVQVTVRESRPDGGPLAGDHVTVEFAEWDLSFSYTDPADAAASLESDLDAALVAQGFLGETEDSATGDGEPEPVDEASDGGAASEARPEVSEPNAVVRAVRTLARRVARFLNSWFAG
jgi:hypothetical protein